LEYRIEYQAHFGKTLGLTKYLIALARSTAGNAFDSKYQSLVRSLSALPFPANYHKACLAVAHFSVTVNVKNRCNYHPTRFVRQSAFRSTRQ
jgi:hypothetical protein